jgi:multicomponent Na+:H+ antiporter subunit E
MTGSVVVVLGLAVVFCLTLATDDPVDLGLGAVLGAALVAGLRGRLALAPEGGDAPLAQRLAAFPVFAGAVLWDITTGTWDVALRVLHVRPLDRPGIVAVPMGERTPRGVAVSALATTLSPGTVLIDVDWDRRVMLLHVIDATDPDEVRAREQRFYERYQRRVFP